MAACSRSSLALSFTLLVAATAHAQNWPQFRGNRAGVAADDPRLPDTWSATENIAWKIDVPGRSWSSPVVWGNHVFVLTAVNSAQPNPTLNAVGTYLARSLGGPMTGGDITKPTDEHRWVLYDVDFQTGKINWERAIQAAVPSQTVHQKNSYASETPVTDGERVYVYVGYVGLFAFDLNGKPAWSKPMTAPKMRTGWGSAASPVLHDGRLYIVNDNDERSFVAAFDARTGNELWRTERADEGSNWSTPFVWQHDLRTEIVTTGTKKVRSYDTSGKLLWELAGMTSIHAVTPFSSHGLLFVSSGYFPDSLRPTYAIRPGAAGDISLKGEERTNAFVVWSHPTLASAYPSPIVVGDQYYTLMDRGFMTSNDPKTGKEIYGRQRIAVDSGTFSASPWSYNGKIFAVSEDGDTFVMQAGPELKVLGRNSLGEMTLASPAVANGSLIMRTATKLYRIARAQDPPVQPAGRGPRVSPPQPQQPQSADYFVGAWTFTWIGRESPVSAGPRTGTLTYVRKGTSGVLDLRAEGTVDGGAAYTETGTVEWNADKKTMTWVERLSTGVALRSIGDWSSPIGIRAESEPVKTGSQTIRVRRLYSILSPQSYMVTEEISVNGGPYQRLGTGRFQKNP